MREARLYCDIGPGAGEHGRSRPRNAEEIMANKNSTPAYLSGRIQIPVPKERANLPDG